MPPSAGGGSGRSLASGLSSAGSAPRARAPAPSDWRADRGNIALLVLLYAIQGLPMGFVFGSIPFMLKERVSYDALAAFSFAGWPYSIKLFIAPVVDSVYSRRVGRRKTWICAAQAVSGSLFALLAPAISRWVERGDVSRLTPVFFMVMSVTACQDIAVDSWALTLLQTRNMPYASTCQSVGLGVGYFATFTIFLALSDAPFCDAYLRPVLGGAGALATLPGMMRSIGLLYIVITVLLFLLKAEDGTPAAAAKAKAAKSTDSADLQAHMDKELLLPVNGGGAAEGMCSGGGVASSASLRGTRAAIGETYVKLFRVTKLPAIRQLIAVLLVAKVGFAAFDNVSALKLLDAGFSKQTMALMAVFQAPVSLVSSVVAGRLAAQHGPVRPYAVGYALRAGMSLSGPALVWYFRRLGGVDTPFFYALLLASTILYSIGSDVMFVCVSAFFLGIGDKDIGGSYLTLLATCSNLGGMWPKSVALFLVDRLSSDYVDGYYVLSFALLPVCAVTGFFVCNSLSRLLALPTSAWRGQA